VNTRVFREVLITNQLTSATKDPRNEEDKI
jgi:hypothetical protein